jgi:hypothetical protein
MKQCTFKTYYFLDREYNNYQTIAIIIRRHCDILRSNGKNTEKES